MTYTQAWDSELTGSNVTMLRPDYMDKVGHIYIPQADGEESDLVRREAWSRAPSNQCQNIAAEEHLHAANTAIVKVSSELQKANRSSSRLTCLQHCK